MRGYNSIDSQPTCAACLHAQPSHEAARRVCAFWQLTLFFMGPPGLTVLFASTLNLLTRLPGLPVLSVSAPNFLTRAYVRAIIAYIGAPEDAN